MPRYLFVTPDGDHYSSLVNYGTVRRGHAYSTEGLWLETTPFDLVIS